MRRRGANCTLHDSPDGTIVMLEKWTSRDLLDAHSDGAAVADLNG